MAHSKLIEAFDLYGTVSTDTRRIKENDIFFALKGENFNGNKFASAALDSGAKLAVIDEEAFFPENDSRYLLVDDVLKSLQDLALHYRRSFEIPVIGITGTNGKTTTKELLHAVLSTEKKVHATAGNLNNHIGVPLTLLSMPRDTEIAIIEMGANKPGDIAELCAIAEPNFGLITNIGQAHLECFGDVEGVQKTKGELFDFIRLHNGMAFVNEGDKRVTVLAKGIREKLNYGTLGNPFYVSETRNVGGQQSLSLNCRGSEIRFQTALIGRHNAENILAAVTVGSEMKISTVNMQNGIKLYVPKINRTQMVQGPGFEILLDAYNANPSSMRATIDTVGDDNYGRVALILGDMFELGPQSEDLHREVLQYAVKTLPEALVIGLGKGMSAAMAAMSLKGKHYQDVAAASPHILNDLKNIDFVLIKGSRGMALERLLQPMGLKS